MTIWLPDCRDFTNPCSCRIRQTLRAEKTRSLGMGRFERSHLHAPVEPTLDFFFIRIFQQQLDGLFDHPFCVFNRAPLAGNAQFRTRGHKPILFAFDDGGQFRQLHGGDITSTPMILEGGTSDPPTDGFAVAALLGTWAKPLRQPFGRQACQDSLPDPNSPVPNTVRLLICPWLVAATAQKDLVAQQMQMRGLFSGFRANRVSPSPSDHF